MISRLCEEDIALVIDLEAKTLNTTLGYDMLFDSITNPLSYFYVYKIDNKLAGYISCNFDGSVIEILNICVYHEFQHQNIGTSLINFVKDELLKINASSMFLEVRESNINAISFYTHLGFKEIHRRRNYYKSEDAIVMQLCF